MSSGRILVADDEPSVRDSVGYALAQDGFDVTSAADGDEAAEMVANGAGFDLLILDIMMPGQSGLDICREVRSRSAVPIILLTAKDAEVDKVVGLEVGADDYVTKPFSVSELLARVRALLRRAGKLPREEQPSFQFGRWRVDPAAQRARHGDEDVELTQREIEILALFVREAGRIVSRRMLLQEVWGFANPERIETRTVDMQIVKLRRKLGVADAAAIETVRGAGYRFLGGD